MMIGIQSCVVDGGNWGSFRKISTANCKNDANLVDNMFLLYTLQQLKM